MKIVFIGAGNLATNLSRALFNAGNDIVQVFSRTIDSASRLAAAVGGLPVTSIDKVTTDADVYILAVRDSVMPELIPELCRGRENKIFIHTAGSVPMDVFSGMARHYGVIYPMQTFSKKKLVDFDEIPCFIEGSDDFTLDTVARLADGITEKVFFLKSDARKQLHLAAVFACNFANHCYEIASELLAKQDIPFDVMLPLIDETAAKVHTLTPRQAQTGPAVRYDQSVIRQQSEMMKDNPIFRQIYECMSISINRSSQNKN